MSCDPPADPPGAAPVPGADPVRAVRRRRWLLWAGAALGAAARPVMAQGAAPADAKQRLAAATGAPVGSLKSVQRLALPATAPAGELWLVIGEVNGDPKPRLVLLGAPAGSAAPGASPVVLPTAARVDLLAQLDLQGKPRQIDPSAPALDPATAWSGRPAEPALLLRTRHRLDGGEQREVLVLVALKPAPVVLWEEIASSLRPTSEGHRSFSLEFVAEAAAAPWLGIHLFQTSAPAANQPPGMPGPPLRLRFVYRGGAFQRAGG